MAPSPQSPALAPQAAPMIRFQLREGFALTAELAGPPDGPRVVLVHGGAQSRRAWDVGVGLLSRAGYRSVAIDMRGHGDSDWAPDGNYALEHWAEDLRQVVTALAQDDPRPIALVGASRGGQSVLLTAVDLPALVSCAVLIDVTPQNDESGIALIRAFMQRSAQGFDSVRECADAVADFMKRPRRSNVSGLARILRQDADGRWFWRWDPRMADSRFVRPPSEQILMEEAAREVGVPVLLVRAGMSELVRAQDVEHFRALLPTLEVEEVPGIPHMITGDSNAAFLPAVIAFLRRRHEPIG
ncbi:MULTISPECIES: alpha/beta fold hydrolase [unclassified Chelatococcus]|uniref:alpha/beta fold hydrolase n=1 Tax=unclassified Chelatococcus TaxID=2638111 RepID=UPI001BCFC851|nr:MULTISPECIES: alpha/beta fold hydrolase [unclassified Chelatococcus]CAH1652833.1 Pimeloyl-ACP methyl ester carboxylesterase [Hyphomicrobiales bacterium]MBS7742981.1 alpha/beta fold hydrolase [Chelatococcus sp. HY11]MBX3541901.1 alpha/beta fold hydrolase [Chelatococcus sp.]MCO5074208.1 alpha/beta hydrolase [Chelatococcus sp.]CAH1694077.1 Pimeloyl-ACP methyl ester carboxylesterase [Hyphomicrobiales bacterium]